MPYPAHFRRDLDFLQAKDLKNYIEKAVKRLLGFENDGDFLRFLLGQNESSPSPNLSFPTAEEKEAVYRAVTNRLYYSYYQFFRWYIWKNTTETPIEAHDEHIGVRVWRADKASHGKFPETIKDKVASHLPSTYSPDELEDLAKTLYGYRKHADYHLEIEFGDVQFRGLLQCYRQLLHFMEVLSSRRNP